MIKVDIQCLTINPGTDAADSNGTAAFQRKTQTDDGKNTERNHLLVSKCNHLHIKFVFSKSNIHLFKVF